MKLPILLLIPVLLIGFMNVVAEAGLHARHRHHHHHHRHHHHHHHHHHLSR